MGTATDWRNIRTGLNGAVIAIKTDGTLWTWGDNTTGQLGDGTETNRSTPMRIGTATDWQSIEAGAQNTLAISIDGALGISGYNSRGELGDGTNTQSKIFRAIACPVNNVTPPVNNFAVEKVSIQENQLRVYPNPVQDIVTISSEEKILSVTVYNTAGKSILTKEINDTKGNIDLSGVLSGVYQINVRLVNNLIKTAKIIKR